MYHIFLAYTRQILLNQIRRIQKFELYAFRLNQYG